MEFHYVRIKYKGMTILLDKEDEQFFLSHKWYPDRKGYLRRNRSWKDGRTGPASPRLHREIMGAASDQQVDHVNHNVYDNRKSNLRLCSSAENARNCRKKTPSRTNLKGVYPQTSGRFYASIRVNKKLLYLGTFDTAQEAAQKYNEAARLHFGEFASLNQVS